LGVRFFVGSITSKKIPSGNMARYLIVRAYFNEERIKSYLKAFSFAAEEN